MAMTPSASSDKQESNDNCSLFLFDFDGVVCNSCDECTVSALRTLRKLNVLEPEVQNSLVTAETEDKSPPAWVFERMREIRPAIEVGWQIPVLLSHVLDQHYLGQKAGAQTAVSAMAVPEIIDNYQTIISQWLAKHDKTEQDMIDTFGSIRDEWIQTDLNSWLDINTFYPGVPDALCHCGGKERILVTTKQQRFAIALCRHAGVDAQALPDDCIYGLGQYNKKSDVIVDRMLEGKYAPHEVYFFEDRWPTLVKCLKDERLMGVRLHLCKWGYVTEKELELARSEPRVSVVDLEEFARIVKGGGC